MTHRGKYCASHFFLTVVLKTCSFGMSKDLRDDNMLQTAQLAECIKTYLTLDRDEPANMHRCNTTCFTAFPQLAEGSWPLPGFFLACFFFFLFVLLSKQFSSTIANISRCRSGQTNRQWERKYQHVDEGQLSCFSEVEFEHKKKKCSDLNDSSYAQAGTHTVCVCVRVGNVMA